MTPADASPPVDWQERANEAARSVTALFGRRLFFLPGTHLGAIQWPAPRWRNDIKGKLLQPWHYWWQAHYVDCLVDAGRRELGNGATPAARFNGPEHASAGRLASRLLTGIRLRNAFTYINSYYDDMAWLALATLRLDTLAEETRRPGRGRNAALRKALTLQFDEACTDDLGGGSFWSKKRDFKNTPATAPVALFYARTGQRTKAQSLLDWLDGTLFDPEQGLYLDGARLGADGNVLIERAVYTYNQGPVLGALLELGGDANLARAAALVEAVDRHLTVSAGISAEGAAAGGLVLRCEGNGDGGLFTGILCRYLALAAADPRLPREARSAAARLVTATAEAFWQGKRRGDEGAVGACRYVFSMHAARPAALTYPPGSVVELSTQLQAWMSLEAAAALPGAAWD
ncbi:putative alpha-1,6-mannanase (GH76 family) [Arthrobacter sp. SLBN-100]|uniref:glycoside hydrolase family 76 protein n=1 Tax=Arthrobacter sp. SLBN-100 TaxID=2768450 RepID=UPI00114F8AD3|nr:glycoside hydrolase family 76 protein [Arthrobacter sp. SLBN-100]TQJ69328.1 putative alpha-1,6-mannanase (GH76 family) [Arthrobacter sp. SLBN-100]